MVLVNNNIYKKYKMSSVLATTASSPGSKSSQETKFRNITTPSYYDGNAGSFLPIPFSYVNGTLDINIQGSVQDFIDNGNFMENYSFSKVRQMGGSGLVQALGPNFVQWINNLYGAGPITIVQPSQITRVQVLNKYVLDGINKYMAQMLAGSPEDYFNDYTSDFPASDNMLYTGEPADNYGSVVVFQSPLVINVDGFNFTFTTQFENNMPLESYSYWNN